ncbi:MAG: hypothetical protein ACJ8C4_07090 [Gemmataceae bacterium]
MRRTIKESSPVVGLVLVQYGQVPPERLGDLNIFHGDLGEPHDIACFCKLAAQELRQLAEKFHDERLRRSADRIEVYCSGGFLDVLELVDQTQEMSHEKISAKCGPRGSLVIALHSRSQSAGL